MEESNWYGIDVCVECDKKLSDRQRGYSGGICPFCGHNSYGTFCITNTVIAKEIKHNNKKWWQFWKKRKFTYIGKDEFSQKWLLKR